mgnify:CR=1 FL=1
MKFALFLPASWSDKETVHQSRIYGEVVEQVQYAEELGFDSLWIAEHHSSRYGIFPSLMPILAHIAAHTKTIRLGAGVSVLPFHHPIRLAEEAAMVDLLSNGRLNLGVGRGSADYEYGNFNIDFDSRNDRFREVLDIILGLWTTEDFSYHGEYYQVDGITIAPRPLQKPHPPVHVAVSRTAASIDSGKWAKEIVAIDNGERMVTHEDEDHVVRGTTPETLSELRTAFGEDSLVTAGNASGVVDGAAVVVIKSKAQAEADGDRALARIVSWGIVGLEPAIMAYGPVPSSRLALERAGLEVDDIDRWEINEAFAGQAVACIKDLGLDIEKVNVNGGAVGIGHPLAATGSRLVLTLAHELRRSNGRYGVATACIGGGQGIAIVIETEDHNKSQ